MATTSIWRVKGWLGKVVVYVENPDKTTNPKFFTDKDMAEQDGQELSDVIRYAVNSRKTQKADNEDCAVVHRFVSGINCSPSTARDEMLAVKKRFGKESGTVAYHGYQSFAPGEATPEMAHEIGMKLAARLWGDRYQVIVATHLDKENHLHNHFVLNTVSFVDGIKYHRTKKDYHDMQTVSDELCREYRLSVIENPQYGKAKQYGEWRAEQEQRPTWRGLIRTDMDEAIRQSTADFSSSTFTRRLHPYLSPLLQANPRRMSARALLNPMPPSAWRARLSCLPVLSSPCLLRPRPWLTRTPRRFLWYGAISGSLCLICLSSWARSKWLTVLCVK